MKDRRTKRSMYDIRQLSSEITINGNFFFEINEKLEIAYLHVSIDQIEPSFRRNAGDLFSGKLSRKACPEL